MSPQTRRASAPVALLTFLPVLHPALIPVVGVASHLAWFLHIGAVAIVAFLYGRVPAGIAVALSAVLVAAGESLFGAGWWVPAPLQTVVSLSVAVTIANGVIAGLALYGRSLSREYRLLFEAADLALLRLDDKDGVVEGNQAATRLFSTSGESPVGRSVTDLFADPSIPDRVVSKADSVWTGRVEAGLPDSRRPVWVDLRLLDSESGDRQLLVRDRSYEMNQREELERQSKLASLGEALAGVAHELNNPLAVILAHAEVELNELPPGDSGVQESLATIRDQAVRMRDLVGELLGFSRTRKGSGVTSVADAVERVVRVQQITGAYGLSIEVGSMGRGEVEAPANQVEQVLVNLVGNAVWAARNGQGEGRVVVSVDAADGGVVAIRVEDDGDGIPEGSEERIFEPFVTTKPEGEGTGLGLAICRRLARGWGGSLGAANRPGGGAVFTLRMPAAGASGSDEPAVRGEEVASVT